MLPMNNPLMNFFYEGPVRRWFLCLLMKMGLPKLMVKYLNSPMSKNFIQKYIAKNDIPMDEFKGKEYKSFAEFFVRKKEKISFDPDPDHFISPCDGWFSAYPIRSDSSFEIKGSHYRVCDLIDDEQTAEEFYDGICFIFRLSPSDYHHYAFVDDGYVGPEHYIEGTLHSVQPVSCEAIDVYRLNRRCWTLLETEHFGKIVQIEIGALAVGGIVNDKENDNFKKGEYMGHFELCGSTIVMLIRKNMLKLLPEIQSSVDSGQEHKVFQGMYIADRI